ncbi:hypothetical protein ATL31_1903 [Phycicoccus duodecadis]|uniref:Uncharacterized protein n=1 Tax=Phycicoccus duodecadis TaxID=173053 RepID=A0A2N3YJP2_9MICO|nr:hypothetical protein ATL31_1903 [Phycicoccus duodecadis]
MCSPVAGHDHRRADGPCGHSGSLQTVRVPSRRYPLSAPTAPLVDLSPFTTPAVGHRVQHCLALVTGGEGTIEGTDDVLRAAV